MVSISFIVYLFAVMLLTATMLFISHLLNPKTVSRDKQLPFESGIVPVGDTNIRWRIDYFLVAISFVIFDIEAVFIYLWSVVVMETGWQGFITTTFFIIALIAGLIYEVKQQAFNLGLRKKHALEAHKTR